MPRLERTKRWLWGAAAALALAIIIHIDWHIGRPTHHRLSLDWPLHWVLAIPTFAMLAARARWIGSPASLIPIVIAGVVLGQFVEPLFENVFYDGRWSFELPPERWRIFAEFMIAGVVTTAVVLGWRKRPRIQDNTRTRRL